MKKGAIFCILVLLGIGWQGSGAWAIDVGWMQKGVRVWYFGSAGSGMSSDAEEAYLFADINGNTAQLIRHSGINHWSLPTAETLTGSIVDKGPNSGYIQRCCKLSRLERPGWASLSNR